MHPNDILNTISNKIGPSLTLTSVTIEPPNKTSASGTSVAQLPVNALSIAINGNITNRNQVIDFERALAQDGRFSGITYNVTGSSSTGYGQTINNNPTNQTPTMTFQLNAFFSNTGNPS